MKTQAIVPARIEFAEDGTPFAPEFGDVYHARAGALAQARHVFLGGNDLPKRWRGRERFVVLETGFGLGNNFLATWQAWREDPARPRRLVYVAIEKHPPRLADLRRVHEASPLKGLADSLVAHWPALTPNLHPIDFEDGAVRLMLALGDASDWLPEIVAEADAFYLDGFSPARNPQMWDRRIFRALARLAAPGATAATWSVARSVKDGLREAGFSVRQAPGFSSKGEMSLAVREAAFEPRRPPARQPLQAPSREAIVVGAGLAGAAVAHALSAEGWSCTVLDRHRDPGSETSGNPAGLFHGVVHPDDGAHARFNRAAALAAERAFRAWLPVEVPGEVRGLLRMAPEADCAAMSETLRRLGLPPDYVRAVDAREASAIAGLPLAAPAWHYPGGGWLAPPFLARRMLQGTPLRQAHVQALRHAGGRWQALDPEGRVIAEAPVVVLANAADAMRLLDHPDWPLTPVRGQVTVLDEPGPRPRVPIAGGAYAISMPDGRLLCGATHQARDEHPLLREEDHRENLGKLQKLLGRPVEWPADPSRLAGRVGWRVVADDRMPVLGPVPVAEPAGPRLEQPRFVPRREGLYAITALGSRGIAWAPLAGKVLAAWIAGSPLPLEAGLLDAVDPARFISRRIRAGG